MILHQARPVRRSGFTLLELLLATLAGVMLLGGLYMAMNMTLQQTQSARDAAYTEDLTRGVFNRISLDLAGTLGPLAPKSGTPSPSSSTTTTVTVTATTTTTTPKGTSSSTAAASSTSTSSSGTAQSGVANVPFQSGIMGQQTQLVVFNSRVPDVLSTPGMLTQLYQTQNSTDVVPQGDLRRVVYWLGNNGGLYRYETPYVTGDQVWNLTDLPITDDDAYLLAREVKDLYFEYLDPSSGWGTTWDGTGSTSPPSSGSAGPPPAVRVTLTFEFPNAKGGPPVRIQNSQTFAIGSAAGPVTQTVNDPVSSSGSSTGGSSGSTVTAKTVGAKTVGGKSVGATPKTGMGDVK